MLGLCKSSTPAPLSKGDVFWCLGRKMSKMSGKVCTDVNAGCWINCTDISLTMYLDSWFTDLENWMYVFKLFNHPSRTFHHDLQHLLSKNAKPWIPRSKTTKMWRDAARTWPLSLPARWCVMMSHDLTIFMFKLLDSVFPDSTHTKPRSPADFATLAVDPWETPRSDGWCLPYLDWNRDDLLPKVNRVLTVLCWQVFQGKAFNDLRPRETSTHDTKVPQLPTRSPVSPDAQRPTLPWFGWRVFFETTQQEAANTVGCKEIKTFLAWKNVMAKGDRILRGN